MNIKKNFILNTSIIGVSKFIEQFISFLIIILISNSLGAKGFGEYSFLFSMAGLFFIFSDFGIPILFTKSISKNFKKINFYFSDMINAKIILIILINIIMILFIFLTNKTDLLFEFILVNLILSLQNLYVLNYNILTVKTKGIQITITNIIERLITLFGALFIYYYTQKLILFLLFFLFANFVKYILLILYTKKYFTYKFNFIKIRYFELLKKSFPFILIGFFYMIYSKIDTVMLGFMKNYEVVGFYNAAYKLIETFSFIVTIVLTFGFPLISAQIKKNKKIAKDLFENIINIIIIIAIPITTGIFILSERILNFLYNFSSTETIISLQILSISIIFSFLTSVMAFLLIADNKEKIFAYIAGIGAIFNIILNLILIPKYSLYGASFTTTLTFFLMCLIMHVYIKKYTFNYRIKLIPTIITSIIMGIIINNILELHLILIIGISAMFYSTIIFIFYYKLIIKYIKEIKNK